MRDGIFVRILAVNPQSWTVSRLKLDGAHRFLDSEDERWHFDGSPIEIMENFTFEATIEPYLFKRSPQSGLFYCRDVDDGTVFPLRLSAALALFKHVISNPDSIERGGIKTQFTFVKFGKTYSIFPLKGLS